MPSVVAGISEEMDQLIDEMVDRGTVDSRSEAANLLMEYAAVNKYDRSV